MNGQKDSKKSQERREKERVTQITVSGFKSISQEQSIEIRPLTIMPARVSRRLVIDASVARSAGGEEATFPTSKHCRDFLKAVLAICHCIVMTPEISEEWRQHRSNFARLWLVSMMARKKVHRLGNVVNEDLRGRIERAVAQAKEPEREEMRKDLLLIEAAIATDRTVISLDDAARGLFTVVARSVGELRHVAWVNPGKPEERLIPWLENGAMLVKQGMPSSTSGHGRRPQRGQIR